MDGTKECAFVLQMHPAKLYAKQDLLSLYCLLTFLALVCFVLRLLFRIGKEALPIFWFCVQCYSIVKVHTVAPKIPFGNFVSEAKKACESDRSGESTLRLKERQARVDRCG